MKKFILDSKLSDALNLVKLDYISAGDISNVLIGNNSKLSTDEWIQLGAAMDGKCDSTNAEAINTLFRALEIDKTISPAVSVEAGEDDILVETVVPKYTVPTYSISGQTPVYTPVATPVSVSATVSFEPVAQANPVESKPAIAKKISKEEIVANFKKDVDAIVADPTLPMPKPNFDEMLELVETWYGNKPKDKLEAANMFMDLEKELFSTLKASQARAYLKWNLENLRKEISENDYITLGLSMGLKFNPASLDDLSRKAIKAPKTNFFKFMEISRGVINS